MPKVCTPVSQPEKVKVEVKHNEEEIYFDFERESSFNHQPYNSTRKIDNDAIKRSIADSCSYSNSLPTRLSQLTKKELEVFMKHIIVNDDYKFLYCYTPKVACSNWKKVIKLLYGQVDSIDQIKKMDHSTGFKKLSDYSQSEIEYRMTNYYKYMFVRDPSERIVSAYRNKFNEIQSFYQVFGKKIMDLYHPEKSRQTYEGKVAGDDVAFSDFVRYLGDKNISLIDLNEHYMPMNLLCQPCIMDYDFVGTTDNIEADSETVLRAVKAPSDVHFPKRQAFYKPTSKSLEHYYFSLLTPALLTKFTDRFALDYQLFTYEKPYFLRGNIILS